MLLRRLKQTQANEQSSGRADDLHRPRPDGLIILHSSGTSKFPFVKGPPSSHLEGWPWALLHQGAVNLKRGPGDVRPGVFRFGQVASVVVHLCHPRLV